MLNEVAKLFRYYDHINFIVTNNMHNNLNTFNLTKQYNPSNIISPFTIVQLVEFNPKCISCETVTYQMP